MVVWRRLTLPQAVASHRTPDVAVRGLGSKEASINSSSFEGEVVNLWHARIDTLMSLIRNTKNEL
jgi:hypothetical protein